MRTRDRRVEEFRGGCLVGLAILLLLAGCAIERPSAPSTEFVLSIPVANDSTRIEDIVGERDFLQTDPESGGMLLHFSREVGRVEIGDRLRISAQEASFAASLPPLEIEAPELPELVVPVDIPGAGESDQAVPLRAQEFSARQELALSNDALLEVQSGRLEIAVRNDLPVALERLDLELLGERVSFGRIDPGRIEEESIAISDKAIGPRIGIEVAGRTAAGNGVVPAHPSLTVSLALKELVVSIPPQSFGLEDLAIPLSTDPIRLEHALMREGELVFRVVNQTPLPIRTLEITLRDLKRDGRSITCDLLEDLGPGESTSVSTLDLTGVEFAPPDPGQLVLSFAGEMNRLRIGVPFVHPGGKVSLAFDAQEMAFSQVEGWLNRLHLSMPEVEREIDFPVGLEHVALSQAWMDIYFTSAIGFLADVKLQVSGTNRAGETGELVVEECFERALGDTVSTSVSVAPKELLSFLNLLPTQVIISPEVRIGDGRHKEVIASEQWVSIDSVVFRTMPRLAVEQDTRIDPEVRDITFRDSKMREKVETHFRRGRIIVELENSMPLGVGVRLLVGRTPEGVYDLQSPDHVLAIPGLSEPPFQIAAAPIDEKTRYSIGTVQEKRELELTREEVLEFILEDDDPGRLYSGVRVFLPATNGEVEIRKGDFINTIAGLKVELLLDKDLLD